MDITLTNLPALNLRQLDIFVPKIINKYSFISPDKVRVEPMTASTLTPGEIVAIQSFVFDPCAAFGNYDPVKYNQMIRKRDGIHALIQPFVGAPAPDIATYEYVFDRNGIDPVTGFILPIVTWDPDPQEIINFKASPCYVP